MRASGVLHHCASGHGTVMQLLKPRLPCLYHYPRPPET
jgi:hypothetical protein